MKFLKALHCVSSDPSQTFQQKLASMLKLGCDTLGLETGVVGRIENDEYIVVQSYSESISLEPESVLALENTLCADTLKAQGIVCFHNIADSPHHSNSYIKHSPVGSYIGMPLEIDGKPFGTISFSSSKPRELPFNDTEMDYLFILSKWVSTEIVRDHAMAEMVAYQRSLERQNQKLEQLAELAGVGTWEIDVERDEIHWSDALRRLYELPEDFDVSYENRLDIVVDENVRDEVQARIRQCIESGTPVSMEMEVRTFNGKPMWIAIQAQSEFEGGKCIRVLGATQDITHRIEANKELIQRRDEAERALQSRSLFLANMSHEIRTPMNGVLGMLEALRKTELTESQREFCQIGLDCASSLLGLINDILDFSKIDSGELELEQVPLNISDTIRQLVNVFSHPASMKGLTLAADTTATDSLSLLGDPTRIRQIITNLVNNAIKFTEVGGVTIKTKALPQQNNVMLIQLSVSDTGQGIDPARQNAIFSPFQQGDSATTREYGGTGLGLSIVRQLAESMGGGVRVSSKSGKGSTFIVALRLPVASDEAVLAQQQEEKGEDGETAHFDNRRVLVVEDNAINQIVITEQLRDLGISPEIAENGVEGVEKVLNSLTQGRPFDLILMDCQMPLMDGYTASNKIRALGTEAQRIPIIALTANAMAGEREKCILAGMNDYLTKPVDSKRLCQFLTRYLNPALHEDGAGI